MPLPDALVLVVLFVGSWTAICWLLARLGGWRRLAEHYAQGDRPFEGEVRRFARVSLGPFANYGTCLMAGRGEMGIRLALFRLVLAGHPPLLIPWEDVLPPSPRGVGPFRRADLRFAKAPAVQVRVRASLARWLLEGRQKALDRSGPSP
jgi:hypothetical protein